MFYKYTKLDHLLPQIVDFKEGQVRPLPLSRVQLLIYELTQAGYISNGPTSTDSVKSDYIDQCNLLETSCVKSIELVL